MLLIGLIIVLAIIVGVMIIVFLIFVVVVIKQQSYTNDQLISSNLEWADKLRDTVKYYEDELQGLYEDFYGDEEELKN